MSIPLTQPQYQLSNLPQVGDYPTLQAYLDAVLAAYNADPNLSQPAYAPPTDFAGPGGETFHAAGYHGTESAGQLAADVYNRKLRNLDGQNNRLALMSRMKLHPEEAQAAYDAYSIDPVTGLPQAALDPYMANLFESMGIRPTPAADGNQPGGGNPQAQIPTPTADMPYVVYNPATGTYVLASIPPQPGSGLRLYDPTTGSFITQGDRPDRGQPPMDTSKFHSIGVPTNGGDSYYNSVKAFIDGERNLGQPSPFDGGDPYYNSVKAFIDGEQNLGQPSPFDGGQTRYDALLGQRRLQPIGPTQRTGY